VQEPEVVTVPELAPVRELVLAPVQEPVQEPVREPVQELVPQSA